MSENLNNEPQGAETHGLDNLPENERQETQEILDSLKPEGEEDTPKPEEKPEETKEEPKEEEKPEEKQDDEKGEEKQEGRRDVSMMPAYKHKIAEKKWESEKAELQAKLDEYENSEKPSEDKPTDVPEAGDKPEEGKGLTPNVKKLAEELGAEEEAVAKIIDAAKKEAQEEMRPFMLTDEQKQALADLQNLKHEKAMEAEKNLFNEDFEKDILPEIRKEYGDDIPDSVVADLKEKLRDIAYKPEYQKVPYLEIYRGKQDFRGVIAPKRKTAETSKGGFFQIAGKTVKYEDLGPDQIANLSDSDFDKYSDYMARREKRGI
jgi:hypothetical protein